MGSAVVDNIAREASSTRNFRWIFAKATSSSELAPTPFDSEAASGGNVDQELVPPTFDSAART